MKEWRNCKNILCIRPDNLGDVLMSYPAIRALKETFNCRITLLTSSAARDIIPFLPAIDSAIIFDAPWVKNNKRSKTTDYFQLIQQLQQKQFDGAVIFTVFSQNPLPSALIAYLAEIPLRLGYCRENPYELLTHWIPDKEPYSFIQHQVERDLQLVKKTGAHTNDKRLLLKLSRSVWPAVMKKLEAAGIDFQKPWLIAHAGVSEPRREYPRELWIETGKRLVNELNYQVILTGDRKNKPIIDHIAKGIGKNAFNIAGLLSLEEFIMLIRWAPLIISVNTSAAHIAAATGTPVIVLYAMSNPQHLPWMAKGRVLPFEIPPESRSRNEVLQYIYEHLHLPHIPMVAPADILDTVRDLLSGDIDTIPSMLPLQVSFEKIF
jgi:lipopolysaccharide heptosyltransferase II